MNSIERKRSKKLLSNSLIFAIGDISSKIILFFMLPFYTSILTTTEYSIADLISTTVSLASPFFTLVISEAVMRFCLDPAEDHKGIFSVGIYIIFGGAILIGLLSFFLFKHISLFKGFWWIFIFYYLSFNLYNLNTQFIKGKEKLKLLAVSGILNTLILVLLNIIFLAKYNMGVLGYLSATAISYTLSALFIMVVGKTYKFILPVASIKSTLIRKMLAYAVPMIPNSAMWWINNSADRYIVTYMVSAAANGIYSVAYKIPSVFSVIMSVFMQAWQISVVKDFGSPEGNKFFNRIYGVFLQAVILMTAGIIVFSRFLGGILYSNDFYSAWKYSVILIIGYLFHSLAGYLGTVYTTVKKTEILFYSTASAAICNIVLNVIFVKIFGTMGAAVATLISYFVAFFIRRIDVKKYIDIKAETVKYSLEIILLILEAMIMIFNSRYSFITSMIIFVSLCVMNRSFFRYSFEMCKSALSKTN